MQGYRAVLHAIWKVGDAHLFGVTAPPLQLGVTVPPDVVRVFQMHLQFWWVTHTQNGVLRGTSAWVLYSDPQLTLGCTRTALNYHTMPCV